MIEIDESIPRMGASSAVFPTVREIGRSLVLAYHVWAGDESAVLRFENVRDWSYGYPNDEGLDAHPLYGLGLEPYAFHVTPIACHGERAWVATFHEGTFTVFADAVEIITNRFAGSPSEAIDSTFGRGLNWTHPVTHPKTAEGGP